MYIKLMVDNKHFFIMYLLLILKNNINIGSIINEYIELKKIELIN